jgi:SAM-dependent methyltransferase
MNFLIRKLLSKGRIMNLVCFVRAFYFCKIKKVMKDYEKVTKDTWEKTLASNKRKIYDKNINLPKHKKHKKIFDIGLKISGLGSSNILIDLLKEKYNETNFKNLKILSIGPRSEGEIFNLYAKGFELSNITGIDLFTYSPLIQLGDMHSLDFKNEQFDIVFMGKCLAYSNNKNKALSEAKRVLVDKGSLIILHSLPKKKSYSDALIERGYSVSSPFCKIDSMDELDSLCKSNDFKYFYSKIIDRKTTQLLAYYGTK